MSSSPFIDKLNQYYQGPKVTSSSANSTSSASTMSHKTRATQEDDRGFQKTENFVMMNPQEANFQDTGNFWATYIRRNAPTH